jgi:tetratricopeptide (TPR) repeat protein
MGEREVIVALAAALVHVRSLDAEPRAPFTAVYRALEDVERLIFHHKEQFGVHAAHFQQGCEEFLLLSNTLAMKALQRAAPEDVITSEQCRDLLLRAEQHTRQTGYLRSLPECQHVNRRRAFRLIALNNLACHAKHTGKPLAAVGFLERALKLQLATDVGPTPASEIALTRLNLCAVLSQLHRHTAAVVHAKAAVTQLSAAGDGDALSVEIAQLLLVAHYNLAVELEHLCDHDAAWRQYECVLTVAERYKLQHDLVRSVRAIRAQGTLRSRPSRQSAPPARTPRDLYNPQRRPLSPKTLRQTRA